VPTLVVYAHSRRGDEALREAARCDGAVTVVALAPVERPFRPACGIGSVLWNRVQRELAEEELAHARLTVEDDSAVTLDVLGFDVLHVEDAIARRARDLGAERVVLADPRRCGLGRRAVRRLRRRCPVPVAEPSTRGGTLQA
jgi:hypothetical protein